MDEEKNIRGPDDITEESSHPGARDGVDRELLEEIRIMIVFRELIRQDMAEFVNNMKGEKNGEL